MRLFTAVILMFVAGFLIQVNLRCKDPEPADDVCFRTEFYESTHVKPFTYGWPFQARSAPIDYGNRLHIPLDERRSEILAVGKWEWIGFGVLGNTAVALLILAAVAIMLEMLHAPPDLPLHWLTLRRRVRRKA